MYTKKARAFAYFACVALIMVTLFSILFIAEETDHDCTGENCLICAALHQAEQTLKQLGAGATAVKALIPAVAQLVRMIVCAFLMVPCVTLIGQKVRLND